jgi:hypothetical protein
MRSALRAARRVAALGVVENGPEDGVEHAVQQRQLGRTRDEGRVRARAQPGGGLRPDGDDGTGEPHRPVRPHRQPRGVAGGGEARQQRREVTHRRAAS